MNYTELTETEKNKLVIKYEPLINKIVAQFYKRGIEQWDNLKSMALEGFALAIKNYDDTRSKMNFMQYAAFSIRNNILTGLDNELRTVKLSNYAQKKAAENGDATGFTSVYIESNPIDKDDDRKPSVELKYGLYTAAKFDDGDVFEYLYTRLESKFSQTECEIFYRTFGLNDRDEFKGKEIAKQFSISEGYVSQKLKKITNWIHNDEELCEMLSNLLK